MADSRKISQRVNQPQRLGGNRVQFRIPEIQAILQIEDRVEAMRAIAGLLVSSTGSRAAFVFERCENRIECVASRVREAIPPELVNGDKAQAVIMESLTAGFVRNALIAHGNAQHLFIAMPVSVGENPRLALAIVATPEQRGQLGELVELMHVSVLALSKWELAATAAKTDAGFRQSLLFLELINRASMVPTFKRGLGTLADEIQGFVGCDKVAIGMGSRMKCRVEGFSAADKFDQRSLPLAEISRLMQEAISVDSPIGWPIERLPQDSELVPAGDHRSLVEALCCEAFLAQPLKMENGETVGAWVCLWQGTVPRKKWETAKAISPHLSATAHLIDLSRPRGFRGFLHRLTTSKFWKKATLPLTIAVAAIGCLWIEVPYRLGAACWVEPETRRQVAAPFDGILDQSKVNPGDLVEKGDVLALLDEKEIRLRIAETRSRLEATRKKLDQALANDDVGATAMADIEVKTLELDLSLWEWQEENLEIRSPITGLVLKGDLEQSEGVPIQRGQELFEIAPIEKLSVRIGVPASEIAHVEVGMPIKMRLESQTSFELVTSIKTIRPTSEVRDNENVFICVAELANTQGGLRPGMRGKARIETGDQRLGWIVFHRFVDYVRLNFPW